MHGYFSDKQQFQDYITGISPDLQQNNIIYSEYLFSLLPCITNISDTTDLTPPPQSSQLTLPQQLNSEFTALKLTFGKD